MENGFARKLILEDGMEFVGTGFGSRSEKKLELVFNTSMAGYQEILSDPSYTDQAVVMTYPIIGNYGINIDDYESEHPSIGALVVREYAPEPSNFRSAETLGACMERFDIAGISGVDTRRITRYIREKGSCKALITDASVTAEEGKRILAAWDYAHDQVSRVSIKAPRVYEARGEVEHPLHIAAIDCGMKLNIVRSLNRMGCRVTVLPWDTDAETVRALHPDGLFLSNGPGDPTDAVPVIKLVKEMLGEVPIFGICLGHQILSLACGAKTYKLKFGHRGGNHPVINLLTDKVEITSQNHSFAVDSDSLAGTGLTATHINILDKTVEGVQNTRMRAFGVQYHPESCPGPQDSAYLFERFISVMKGGSLDA